MQNISGIILMGGQNKRMGHKPKAFLSFAAHNASQNLVPQHLAEKETSFLSHIIEELCFLSPLYLSVDKKEKYNHLPCPSPYVLIEDTYSQIGPIDGLFTSLRAVETDYAFVTACDMPFITKDVVHYMIAQITSNTPCVVFQDSRHRLYPLGALYHKKIVPIIEAQIQAKNYKLQDLLTKIDKVVLPIENTPFSESLFLNINTEEDYRQAFEVD
jgi:molybdopterin-guanine dinucleotide biosynthesis protein A